MVVIISILVLLAIGYVVYRKAHPQISKVVEKIEAKLDRH